MNLGFMWGYFGGSLAERELKFERELEEVRCGRDLNGHQFSIFIL
jgi:hypothetical protein